jgi:hypothetical protein
MALVYRGGDVGWVDEEAPGTYQEGAGGGNTITPQVTTPTATPAQVALPYDKTPEQLGWSTAEADRFRAAGIDMLPTYMSKERLYSTGSNLNGRDPIQFFIDAQSKPGSNSIGKSDRAIQAIGLDPSSAAWDESAQRAYSQYLIHDTFHSNAGAFKESVLPAMQGISSILAPIAGIGALGAFAAPVAGAAAGGMTAAEAGALAGESAAGYGALGASGSGVGSIGGAGGMTVGGNVMGFSNTTPFAAGEGALAGESAATSGSGFWGAGQTLSNTSGTGLFGTGVGATDLAGGSLASGGLFGTGVGGSEVLASAGAGAAPGIWDSISNLFSGTTGTTAGTTGSNMLSNLFSNPNWLQSLIGAGGAIGGGVMANNALQDSIKDMQKYNEPFYNLGVSNIDALNAADPTGGAGKYTDALGSYGTNFKFDATNPAYTQQLAETTRLNDQNLAARGMYNSRAGLNLQDQSARNLTATEFDKQYSRGYTNLMDMFNMTSKTGATNYAKLLDMVKIGSGASSAAGQGSLASGQSEANLWSGLGAMPTNYAILQNMLSGGK